jgi:hypothetical protein
MDEQNRLGVEPATGSTAAAAERMPRQVVAEFLAAFGRRDVEAIGKVVPTTSSNPSQVRRRWKASTASWHSSAACLPRSLTWRSK